MTTDTIDPIEAAKELREKATQESEQRFQDAVRRHAREPLQPAEIVRVCAVTDHAIDAFAQAVERRREVEQAKSLASELEARQQEVQRARELVEKTKEMRIDKQKEFNRRHDQFITKRKQQLEAAEAKRKAASDARQKLQGWADELITQEERQLRIDAAEVQNAVTLRQSNGRHLSPEQVTDLEEQHAEIQKELDRLSEARMAEVIGE